MEDLCNVKFRLLFSLYCMCLFVTHSSHWVWNGPKGNALWSLKFDYSQFNKHRKWKKESLPLLILEVSAFLSTMYMLMNVLRKGSSSGESSVLLYLLAQDVLEWAPILYNMIEQRKVAGPGKWHALFTKWPETPRRNRAARARNTGMKSRKSSSSPKGLRDGEMKQTADHRSWMKRLRAGGIYQDAAEEAEGW